MKGKIRSIEENFEVSQDAPVRMKSSPTRVRNLISRQLPKEFWISTIKQCCDLPGSFPEMKMVFIEADFVVFAGNVFYEMHLVDNKFVLKAIYNADYVLTLP